MTAKQKANRERFKKVVAEAKKLRKKYPKLTQPEAVKKAWAILTGKKVGAVKSKAPVKKKTAVKKKATVKKSYKSSHKDSRSHNVNISVISGMPNYSDPDAAREIELYSDNDSGLYFQSKRPIILNLQKKFQKGTYDVNKAAKIWMYYIENGMKKYHKEFGSRGDKWHELLSVPDRKLLAQQYAIDTLAEFELGNFTN